MDRDWRDRMRDSMSKIGMNGADIATKTGLSVSTISRILRKERSTSAENINLIAKSLGTPIDHLLYGVSRDTATSALSVPILRDNQVDAWVTDPALVNTDKNEWIACGASSYSPKTYAIQLSDNDMIDPTGISSFPQWSIIFVDPELSPFSGGDTEAVGLHVLVKIDDGTIVFRELQRSAGEWYAVTKSRNFRPIPLSKNCRFMGTVLAMTRRLARNEYK